MRALSLAAVLVFGGCVGDGPNPPSIEGCEWVGDAVLEFGQDLAEVGPQPDGGSISYGNPPQGGAPYAPFQIRIHAELQPGVRVPVDGTIVEVGTGEVLATAEQSQAFICSNVGAHSGWLYGGEVHLRFWDRSLEELEGRQVEIDLSMQIPEGPLLEAGATATLSRDL